MKTFINFRKIVLVISVVLVATFFSISHSAADLVVIGEAKYLLDGNCYKLIYDDDVNGTQLTWLDFTKERRNWYGQTDYWVDGLGQALEVTLYPEYSSTIDWTVGWRLPTTVDGQMVNGYDGTTTGGYNVTSSEMGHLFYEELNNMGARDINTGEYKTDEELALNDTGPFDNLIFSYDGYWSDTKYSGQDGVAWGFGMYTGFQGIYPEGEGLYGIAVRPGQVSMVPEPLTIFLLGFGLMGLAGIRRKLRR